MGFLLDPAKKVLKNSPLRENSVVFCIQNSYWFFKETSNCKVFNKQQNQIKFYSHYILNKR